MFHNHILYMIRAVCTFFPCTPRLRMSVIVPAERLRRARVVQSQTRIFVFRVPIQVIVWLLEKTDTKCARQTSVKYWSHGTGLIITPQKSHRFSQTFRTCHAHARSPCCVHLGGMRFITHKHVARLMKSSEFLWKSWGPFLDRTP